MCDLLICTIAVSYRDMTNFPNETPELHLFTKGKVYLARTTESSHCYTLLDDSMHKRIISKSSLSFPFPDKNYQFEKYVVDKFDDAILKDVLLKAEAYKRNIIVGEFDGEYFCKCKKGLFAVYGPDIEKVYEEAKHYFIQYYQDGEYSQK